MIWPKLVGATIALIFGLCTAFRKRTPLYYKIVFFAMASFFLGTGYYALASVLLPEALQGFHVGYFGTIGMFFFLYSSYYGAINSLADGKEKCYWPYRFAAALLAGSLGLLALWRVWTMETGQHVLQTVLLIPIVATAYFAFKHLIFPDVEMGIIAAMRIFNAMIFGLCLLQLLEISFSLEGILGRGISLCSGLIAAFCLPAARNGVKRWFI